MKKNIFVILAFAAFVFMADTSCKKAATPGTNEVFIDNMSFSPASITVVKGTTITWTNKESSIHTATSSNTPAAFDSGDLAKGQSYSFTFTTAGTYTYFCKHHSSMTGTVVVN